MPSRKIAFAPEEYYHIYNRGVLKRDIFIDELDRIRFLFLILHLQTQNTPENISRKVAYFVKHRMFNITNEIGDAGPNKRQVSLVGFTLMDNHFHLLVKEIKTGGISKYLQKLANAYTKYFNTKYQISGYLFQGPFRAVHIADNDQLLYASAYIHRNAREINEWRNTDHLYPWSSFQDYVHKSRWGGDKLDRDIILEQFSDNGDNPGQTYHRWVIESPAKNEHGLSELELEPE